MPLSQTIICSNGPHFLSRTRMQGNTDTCTYVVHGNSLETNNRSVTRKDVDTSTFSRACIHTDIRAYIHSCCCIQFPTVHSHLSREADKHANTELRTRTYVRTASTYTPLYVRTYVYLCMYSKGNGLRRVGALWPEGRRGRRCQHWKGNC